MIELEVQFQIVIVSVVFGMIFTNLYSFIDIMLNKSKVFRGLIELCFFLSGAIGYYSIIYIINNGALSVYMPVCLLFGRYLHKRFYDKYFSSLYKYIFSRFHSIIEKRKRKWRLLWKELTTKKTKEEKSTE